MQSVSVAPAKFAGRSASSVISKARMFAWLLFGVVSMTLAEKTVAVSDDFLEYLGDMENTEDNWSDLAQESAGVHGHQSSSATSRTLTDSSTNPANTSNTSAAATRTPQASK